MIYSGAAKFYELGCDLESRWSCSKWGNLLEDQIEIDYPNALLQAEIAYERGCNLFSQYSCKDLGFLNKRFENEANTDLSIDRAFAAFQKGCILGNHTSCVEALSYSWDLPSFQGAELNDLFQSWTSTAADECLGDASSVILSLNSITVPCEIFGASFFTGGVFGPNIFPERSISHNKYSI